MLMIHGCTDWTGYIIFLIFGMHCPFEITYTYTRLHGTEYGVLYITACFASSILGFTGTYNEPVFPPHLSDQHSFSSECYLSSSLFAAKRIVLHVHVKAH